MNKEKFNIINKENINKMVIEFYMGILFEENEVSRIFKDKLGDDIITTQWQEHITLLTNFWAMLVLKDTNYNGKPMKKHLHLGLTKDMFHDWLDMFYETIDSLYEDHLAKIFKTKANEIADSFMKMLSL